MASQADWKTRIIVCAQAHAEGNHKPLDELCKDILRLQEQQFVASQAASQAAPEVAGKPATPDRDPHDTARAVPRTPAAMHPAVKPVEPAKTPPVQAPAPPADKPETRRHP